MSDKSTSSLVVDMSNFKKAMNDAKRSITAARAEFNKTTADMDDWSKSTDGLSAKIKQLTTTLDNEKIKLASLNVEYEQIVKEQGESSAAAEAHRIKIDKQTVAITKTEKALQKYKDKLSDLESDYSKATQEISKQEDELEALKKEYSNIILTQDKSSEAAQEVAAKIGKLSTELQENKKALEKADSAADEFDNTLEKVDDSAEEAGDGFTVMKGALANLVADGIRNIASNLATEIKNMFVESTKAYSNFQAQTGESTEAMAEFKEEINDLYKNNYGDSLEDVADKMAYVKQVTGEVNPSKLRELTENAIALEDTFGSDFNETIRGVSNLMEHFEIDSKEAFDLFAKGSQKGLDYTGELGDNVAEYGGNFKQAGYSAQEYFQLLENGSQGGAYNLDKVNDSINEIKNRLGDGSIKENLKIYSKNTKNTFHDWEDGKSTMKDVIDSIVSDIKSCKNEQEALNMAAVAFGTMGEDANLDVVKSLTTVGHSFKDVKGSMEGIKKIKYDNIEDQFKTIGRRLQMDFLAPLAQKALPYVEKFADYCVNNLEKMVPVLKTIGGTIAGAFVINKVATFGQSLGTIVSGLGKIQGLSKGLGALSAVGITLGIINDNAIKAGIASEGTQKLTDAQQKSIDTAKDLISSYDELEKRRDEEVDKADSQVAYYDKLREKLDKIVDKNGKVKKGYEDRATFITSTLNDALGSQLKIEDGFITNYQTQRTELKKLIDLQKAKSNLSANEELYNSAIKDEKTLKDAKNLKYDTLQEQNNKIIDTYYKLTSIQGQSIDRWAKENKIKGTAKEKQIAYNNAVVDLQNELWGQYDIQQDLNESYKVANERYLKNQNTIKNYENLSAAIASGSEKKISNALLNIKNDFVSYKNATKDMLSDQVENTKSTWKSLAQAYENGEDGVTKKAVNDAKKMHDAAVKELDKFEKSGKDTGIKGITGFCEGMNQNVTLVLENGQLIAKTVSQCLEELTTKCQKAGVKIPKAISDGIKSGKYAVPSSVEGMNKLIKFGELEKKAKNAGINIPKSITNGIKSGQLSPAKAVKQMNRLIKFSEALEKADLAGKKIPEKMMKGILSGKIKPAQAIETLSKNINTSADKLSGQIKKTGKKGGTEYSKGIDSTAPKAQKSGKNLANSSKKGAESVSLKPTGKNFGEGFIAGLTSTEHTAEEMTMKWGINRVKDLNKSIESHSPSKATTKTGIFFSQGFINGIKLLNAKAKAESKNLGGVSLKALMLGVDNKSSEVGENLVTNFAKGINSQANNIVKTVKTLITNSIPKGGTKGLGEFFIQSFLNGIKSLNKQVKAESKSLGGASLKGILLGIDDGNFSKVGEKLIKHFSNGINSQASNIVKTVKNLINNSIPKGASRIEKAKKEFEKVAEQLTDSFTKSFEKGASKAVKKVEKAFNSISEKYQDKYDEIAQKQEDLQSTLSDYGSLFERDEDGNIKLSNLNEQINYLKTYDANLKALKSKVSSDLMGVITSMSAEDGADLAAKLLSLSPEELKAFDTAYQEKQKISAQIAKDYYQSEVQSLKDNFTKQIKKQLKTLKKDLKEVGKQSVEGFIKGFKSKNSDVSDTVEAWANSIVKTVKKQLKIKSPSRVFRYEIAGNVIDGFIKGIATRIRSAVNTMKEFSNKVTDSANISIGSAKRGMMLSSGGAVTTNNNNATYNFYQTNNSPKALSRLEIYRRSRNLLNFKAGLKGV